MREKGMEGGMCGERREYSLGRLLFSVWLRLVGIQVVDRFDCLGVPIHIHKVYMYTSSMKI